MKNMNRGDSDEVTGESSQTWNRVVFVLLI